MTDKAPPKPPRARRMAREPEATISASQAGDRSENAAPRVDEAAARADPTPKAPTKIATLITLLEREQGATLDEMVDATGWLQHTTRAALTGLRKKGHTIEKSKRHDVTCYKIVAGN